MVLWYLFYSLMEIEIILLIIILIFITIIFLFNILGSNKKESQDLLVQLNSNLRNDIQNIRKEVNETTNKSRIEIEGKLKTTFSLI